MTYETFLATIHPEDRQRVDAQWQAALKGEPYDIEHRILVEGKTKWVREKAYLELDDAGNPLGGFGITQDITVRKITEDTLKFLITCDSNSSSVDFFQALARYLAESLNMDFVCIDRLQDEMLIAETVAVYYDGKYEDNVSYTLKETPCGDVIQQKVCCFTRDVRHLFPKDAVLQEIAAESYVGTTLWSSLGKPIGLIAIIGRKPLENPELKTSILQMVAVRAAGELERRQAEQALRENEERLLLAIQAGNMATWDQHIPTGKIIWNDEYYQMLGYEVGAVSPSNEALISRIHPDDLNVVKVAFETAMKRGANTALSLEPVGRTALYGGCGCWAISIVMLPGKRSGLMA